MKSVKSKMKQDKILKVGIELAWCLLLVAC